MGKLVRDKIPQIIKENGKIPVTRLLDKEEYLRELDIKLNEEVQEYQTDKSIEEMADVLEVPLRKRFIGKVISRCKRRNT